VLYRHVPAALVDRPKRGFDVPIGAWLNGALGDWARALLEPARLAREGFVDPAAVTRRRRQALAGGKDHRHELWNTLMFQAWLEHWRGLGAVAAE
jgi:asparagine synthase (glutamine-hydrolysing)